MEKHNALLGLTSIIQHIILHNLPLDANRHKWFISGDTLAPTDELMFVEEGNTPTIYTTDFFLYNAIKEVVHYSYKDEYQHFIEQDEPADNHIFLGLHLLAGILVYVDRPVQYQDGQQAIENHEAYLRQRDATDNWDVSIGNVGLITCDNEDEARSLFEASKERSIKGIGREAHEPVVLLCNSEIVEEYIPDTIDNS